MSAGAVDTLIKLSLPQFLYCIVSRATRTSSIVFQSSKIKLLGKRYQHYIPIVIGRNAVLYYKTRELYLIFGS